MGNLGNIGHFYYKQKEYQQAMDSFQKLYSLSRASGGTIHLLFALKLYIGMIYQDLDDKTHALKL